MKQFIELRENLRKQIAQMASKFPEGSKVKMKHGGIGTVLSVTKDSVKVGVGNKTMNHKPSELVAIAKKESVDDMQEKYNQKFPPEVPDDSAQRSGLDRAILAQIQLWAQITDEIDTPRTENDRGGEPYSKPGNVYPAEV